MLVGWYGSGRKDGKKEDDKKDGDVVKEMSPEMLGRGRTR